MKNIIYWAVIAGIASVVISQYEWEMAPILCFIWWAIAQLIKYEYKDHVFWKN